MLATENSADVAPDTNPAITPLAPRLAWKQIAGAVEPFLNSVKQNLTDQIGEFDTDIASYVKYALTNQGKQLRPTLVALSAGATGSLNDSHVRAAVIIEMVHLATLVHDDVIDEADMRRRKPTLAANWGNEISVLVGDCLFAHSLKLSASFPTPEVCRAVASATNTVCTGEIIQTQLEKNFELTRDDYFKVLRMKTGELFALSCELGAFLSSAEAGQRETMKQYGLALGTAYQIFDDCLDLFGSETRAGKSLGTDLVKGKLTLPMLILLDRLPEQGRREIQSLLLNWDPRYLPKIARQLSRYETLEESRQIMEEYLSQARAALSQLPASESRSALSTLTNYLAHETQLLGQAPA